MIFYYKEEMKHYFSITLLGENLDNLMLKEKLKKFSLKTVIMIA